MSIDWKQTQGNLTNAGYPVGAIDGVAGPVTYAMLLGFTVHRQPDATIRMIAAQMPETMQKSGISNTAPRLAEFIAQTANETGGYTTFSENLHYSARRIMQVWPSRFPTLASALPYAWDPSDPDREDIALADRVYGDRMGNQLNGTVDNDGWDDRGGGLIQHTGKVEYEALRTRLGFTPDDIHTNLTKMVIAAADFWTRANVNSFVDRGDFRGARRVTNGGAIGLENVATIRARVLSVVR